MFEKLKLKLKESFSIFSKKAEEEAEEKEIVVEKEVPQKVEKKIEKKEVKEKKVEVHKKEEKPAHKEEKKKEVIPKKKEHSKETKKEEKKVEVRTETKHEEQKEIKKEKVQVKNIPKSFEKISSDEVKITYFVHGTTTDNEKDLATGWQPGELSEKGIKQSKELRETVKKIHFDEVFSSDLKRAMDSAKLTFPDKVLNTDERLREANYGDLTLTDSDSFKPHLKDYVNKHFPNGESYLQVEERIASFLNYLYENYRGKHIAIVAHQAPQLALDVLLKDKTWEQAIAEDWRLKEAWQPGWEYILKNKIEKVYLKEIPEVKEEKRGFFGKIKSVFKKEEVKFEPTIEIKKETVKEEKAEEKKVVEEVEEKEETAEAPEEKTGFFGKIKEKLTTKIISTEKFEELFWDLELALLENNVSVEVIEKIKEDLKTELVDKPLPRDVESKMEDTLKRTLNEILSTESIDLLFKINQKKPYIIAFFGINGSGKTTSIAKLTHYLQQQNKSVVLAACDTFRAAAIQQLEEHADKLKVKMIKHDYGSDAAAVAYDAVKYAEKNNIDVVLIDTAGRLHSNTNLMAELEKIIRVTNPDLKIFVGESITGNDCIEQAQQFNELVDLDGVILTKADVDEKGGAPLSIAYTIKKPIMFLGVGQNYSDFEVFDKEVILGRLGL